MSRCWLQNRRTLGSSARLPVERGLESRATRAMSAARRRADRETVPVIEDDADRLHPVTDRNRGLLVARLQVEERDRWIVREAAAVAPVALGIVAVDVVADRDRIAAGVGHCDADIHRA